MRPVMAHLQAAYREALARPAKADIDAMHTIWPLFISIISGRKVLHIQMWLKKFTLAIFSIIRGSISVLIPPPATMPALFTRMSTRPRSVNTCFLRALTESKLPTSTWYPVQDSGTNSLTNLMVSAFRLG
uniref:Uncharacterized protein n=1 Tax=Cacopsylla melanoneura TaxID=428564 RepID=A0A8D8UCX4_9HEMI